MNIIEKIIQFTAELKKYCYHYYVKDEPLISDKEYDALYDELESMEREAGFCLSDSPTQKVQGEVLEGLAKVTHSKPMLSAAKTKSAEEIKKFVGNNDFYCSYKLDGLTLVVIYEHGSFKQAITRGNGIEGEDVTAQARMITNLPKHISYKNKLELRGECVITLNDFRRINYSLEEEDKYSHPRNLAAGSIRLLKTKDVRDRNLKFVAFECITDIGINDKFQILVNLKKIGFDVVKCGIGEIDDCIEVMQPEFYEYPVDGLIFELRDKKYSESLGKTGHHENCRIAFKYDDDTVNTVFRGIDYKVSRNGIISLTAVFDTVTIDGSEVNRASVHNVDIFNSFEFGVGDAITVYKANMIIPQIDENLTKSGTYKLIDTCPCCGTKLQIIKPSNTNVLFCPNESCVARNLSSFTHFVSKDGMNIDGLSEATLEKLIDKGFIKNFKDIYHLDFYENVIKNMGGFGEKSYKNLIKSIDKSRNVKLSNYIVALGIPLIGRTASKTISKCFKGSYDNFLDAVVKQKFDFSTLDDFGKAMSESLNNWGESILHNSDSMLEYGLATELNFIVDEEKIIANDFINGNIFVVTGKFEKMPRKEIEKIITERGGKLAGSVSKTTAYLLTNDGDSGSSKSVKAKELNIPIMSEEEFISKI